MHLHRLREVVLLTYPVLLLAGLAIACIERPTSLAQSQVRMYPPDKSGNTEVTVTVEYQGRSLYKRFIAKPSWRREETVTYIVDEKGQKYARFNNSIWKRPIECYWHEESTGATFAFWLPLSQIPATAGQLTLRSVLAVDKVKPLPISIIVRQRH